MSKTYTIDLFFNSDNKDTRIPLAQRKADIPKVFEARTFPLYGTFGNSLNKRTIDNFNLTEAAVDFVVKSLDLTNNTAEIEWLNTKFIPDSFDNINVCLAYYINQTNVTELRYAFMQPKVEFEFTEYEIQPSEKEEPRFDFSVALRLLMDGKALSREKWGKYSLTFISLTPGTPNLPQERFWSPCNAVAVGLLENKTANVKSHFTMFNNGEVGPYIITHDDLMAKDWCLNDTIIKALNHEPHEETVNGEDINDIHKEDVLVEK